MNCTFFQEQFSAYYDRELSFSEMVQMATHLNQCLNCQTDYQDFVVDLQLVSAGILAALPDQKQSDQEIINRLAHSLEPNRPETTREIKTGFLSKKRHFIYQDFISVAAVLLIGLGIGLLVRISLKETEIKPRSSFAPPQIASEQVASSEQIGQINNYLGNLEINPDAQNWLPVSLPTALFKNTSIRANQHTKALLSIDKYTDIALNKSTIVKLKDKKHLLLSEGEIWVSRVQPESNDESGALLTALTIELTNGYLEIHQGEVNIQTTPEVTVIMVFSGQAILASHPENRVEIEPGAYGVLHHSSG
ncbi:MAG: zf-HC2 domain-containing protein, partial [Planctomycetota bacterium]